MANKRIIELNERTTINMGDFLMVDDATGSRKLAMSTLFNYLTYSSLMFVDTLPTTDIDPTVIYLVPHSGSTTQWDEYIYRDNQWILIGTSTLDLSSIYQTKTDNSLQTTSKQIVGAINEVNTALPEEVYKTQEIVGTSTAVTTNTFFNTAHNLTVPTGYKAIGAFFKYLNSNYILISCALDNYSNLVRVMGLPQTDFTLDYKITVLYKKSV